MIEDGHEHADQNDRRGDVERENESTAGVVGDGAIELLHRDASFPQWTRAKSFDGFAAFGPWIDTAFDPAAASLRTRVGGRERQNYPLADMFFAPDEIVWRLSQDMTLEPGDLILSGTSLGVLPMKPGTVVEVEIAGLGTLRNTYG